MSYLLETLKRLEEQRQQEGSSDLLTVHGKASRSRRKTVLWPYALSAALLLNAGVAVWWLVPRQGGRPIAIARPSVVVATRPGAAGPAVILKPAKPAAAGGRIETDARKAPLSVTRADARSQTPAEGRNMAYSGREQAIHGAPGLPSDRQAPPVPPKPTEGGNLPARAGSGTNEPSADNDKNRMPPLKISLHSYGPAPESRLVRINDRTLREGEVLPPGIRVEEITADGTILSYEGRRFHLGLDQGR